MSFFNSPITVLFIIHSSGDLRTALLKSLDILHNHIGLKKRTIKNILI